MGFREVDRDPLPWRSGDEWLKTALFRRSPAMVPGALRALSDDASNGFPPPMTVGPTNHLVLILGDDEMAAGGQMTSSRSVSGTGSCMNSKTAAADIHFWKSTPSRSVRKDQRVHYFLVATSLSSTSDHAGAS